MNMKMRARQRWRKHPCPHCKLRQSKRPGSLALTISSKSVSVVIFVDETVHSMPRPLSYAKTEMSNENEPHPPRLGAPLSAPPCSQSPRKRPRPRKQYPPASAPIVTPAIEAPRGILDCSRELTRADRARPMAAPAPPFRGDAGFSLDARRGRDRIT